MKHSNFRKIAEEFSIKAKIVTLQTEGIELADYPWDECIADQIERYGDEETASKVCGYIKSEYGGGE
jgi:hypothetical protein